LGHQEILEGLYGGSFVGSGTALGHGLWTVFDNGAVTAVRMDDTGLGMPLDLAAGMPGEADDDIWTDGTVVTAARARFALFPQEFGYDLGSGFVKLAEVTGSGFSVTGSALVVFDAGAMWQWARTDDSDSGLTNAHYSDGPSNEDGLDHLVTYRILGVPGQPEAVPVWLILWEDLNGPLGDVSDPDNQGVPADRDFNDLAIELVVVPECLSDEDCDDDDPCTEDTCDLVTGECVFTPIEPPPPGCEVGGDGCTPGFWKQPHHLAYWIGYLPTDLFEDVFGVDAVVLDGKTLVEAAWTGGGHEAALGRHAVAALLNASSDEVAYAYTEAEVIALVQEAYATGDFNTYKDMLEEENERGCTVDKSNGAPKNGHKNGDRGGRNRKHR
jgi:hypothetical protein